MGAFLSLESVKTVVEIFILFISFFKGVLLPNQHGACILLPKVMDQLQELEHQKVIHGQDFPGTNLPFDNSKRCQWMKEIRDIRPIGQILWPGTHYSATNNIGIPFITRPFVQRQTMSIYEQLLNGVRALDIHVQQDRLLCIGSMICNTTIDDIIKDIKRFLKDAKFEIILVEIQSERGIGDPENFEDYLVEQFGDLLIHQDDRVFSKSISEVLPGQIICIWKPVTHACKPRLGGPLWSGKFLKCDEIDTQMPLTRFDININNLRSRSLVSNTNKFFYKVENTLNPKTSTILELLLIWPKHANVVSRRINGFARPFLAKCHNAGILHRLQICSVDFVDDDFVSACIQLNYEAISIKPNEDTTVTPEEVNSQIGTVDAHEVAQERISELTEDTTVTPEEEPNEDTTITLQEVISQTDIIDIHEVAQEMLEQNSEETGVLTPNKSSNMNNNNSSSNMGNDNNSINDIKANNTNGNDNTTLTWERVSYGWISPRSLEITHIKDDKCWTWEYGGAHLLRTNSLNVSGNYKVDNLTQGLRYEVLFEVEVLDSAFGWESPLHLRLILPDGSIQQNQVILDMTPTRLRYQYISTGNFVMSRHTKGDIKCLLEQLESTLKGGIVIHSVWIQPFYIDMVIPRNLSIKSHRDPKCWNWYTWPIRQAKGNIEIAQMREVRDFWISGVFETGKLLFGSTYKLAFLIYTNVSLIGWESPTKLTLLLPNGSSQQRIANFNVMPKYGYINVYVGEFKMLPELVGQLKFSMENDDSNQKSGFDIYMAFIEEQH